MPDVSKGIAFIGVEELRAKIGQLQKDIPGDVMVEALQAGAEVIRQAIEAATPTGGEYRYPRPGGGKDIVVSDKHAGRARGATIIYRRRGSSEFGKYAQTTAETAFLVGYEKRRAYYMFWREYGRRNQPARPFFRAAYDAVEETAFQAAARVLTERLG